MFYDIRSIVVLILSLQTVLPKIICHNQHAYVKGRTINDAIRTMDDILVYILKDMESTAKC